MRQAKGEGYWFWSGGTTRRLGKEKKKRRGGQTDGVTRTDDAKSLGAERGGEKGRRREVKRKRRIERKGNKYNRQSLNHCIHPKYLSVIFHSCTTERPDVWEWPCIAPRYLPLFNLLQLNLLQKTLYYCSRLAFLRWYQGGVPLLQELGSICKGTLVVFDLQASVRGETNSFLFKWRQEDKNTGRYTRFRPTQ